MPTPEEILNEIDIDKDDVLVENNAQTIFDHISTLEKEREIHEKRWFWELLQNAKDSVDDGQKVSVDISLNQTTLIFKHTGNPFQRKEILHLIFHGSSKKKEAGKVGRFGTGFMTTHLLSKKVKIRGQLSDGGYFSFLLDRDASDYLDQKKSLDDSYERFTSSITQKNIFRDDFKTEFVYELTEAEIELANKGLQLLSTIAPVVLAFNSKIKSIVKDGRSIINNEQFEILFGERKINKNVIINAEGNIEYVYTYNDFNRKVTLAIPCEFKKGVVSIKNISKNYPKLFFDFPLFGTEDLGIPFIINSLSFDPKRERDGIYLTTAKEPSVLENKSLIESALSEYLNIVEFFSQQESDSLSNLFSFHSPLAYGWLDTEWYKVPLQNAIKKLLDKKGIYLKKEGAKEPRTFSEIKIPFDNIFEITPFFPVIQNLYRRDTIGEDGFREWLEIADQYAKILSQPLELFDFIITKEKTCKLIEVCKSLDTFTNQYQLAFQAISAINWVDSFFLTLSNEELQNFCLNYSIVPTQNNLFSKKTADSPKIDISVDEELKTIAEDYGWEIKSILIHDKITPNKNIFDSLNNEKVLQAIETLNKKTDVANFSEAKKRAFKRHLKWLIQQKEENRIRDLYVYVNEGREGGTSIESRPFFIDIHKRLLAPAKFWESKFSIYRDLVRQKLILHEEYANSLNDSDIQYLVDINVVIAKPLVYRSRNATKTDLKYILPPNTSISSLVDDNGEIKHFNIAISNIPYLVTTDDSILSKTGGSFRSAKQLLRFVLFQILNEDQYFNSNGLIGDSTYTKSFWIGRLRETQWVPIKSPDDDNASQRPERPSTSNIGELLHGEDDLLELLKTEKGAVFFNQLGISVADLIRNTITDSNQKLQWDLAFTKLLTNKNINPQLATAMLEDPGLQEIYEKREAEKKRIHQNQEIGRLFEKIFREIFESNEYKNAGFQIKRIPIGSDFGVIFDNDVIDEKGFQVLFEIKGVLIELKATGKDYAEMTPTQVNKATEDNKIRYVLAVLPLDGFEINQENVLNNTRFVTNIKQSLEQKHGEYETYNSAKSLVIQDDGDIRLHIEDGKIRYQVKHQIWEGPDVGTFATFINWIKSGN